MLIITDGELDALNGLRPFLQCLYILAIRRFMDSKSRIVGIKRKISFQCLAEFLYVEPGRGLPRSQTGSPNKSKIRRGIEELVKYGLIKDKSDGECLIFELPLAPQGYFGQNKPDTNPTRYPDTNFSEKKVVKLETYKNKNKKPDTPKMAYPDTPLISNIDNNNKLLLSNILAEFDYFWSIYPRKAKKQEAKKVWQQMKLDTVADEIIQRVELFKERHRPWLEGFIPHPTTFLRGRRWEDELEEITNDCRQNRYAHKLSPGDIAAQIIFSN